MLPLILSQADPIVPLVDSLATVAPSFAWRIGKVVVATLLAHGAVRLVRLILRAYLRSKWAGRRRAKAITLAHFGTSALTFLVYLVAGGFVFHELDIPLTAYVASATVIGFAVSFGFQGVIQDVITGITLILSDLLDVGDMVDIGGQVGVVQRMGVRFTVLSNFAGADVYIPNRNVANVINYTHGYVRAFVDVRLPDADPSPEATLRRLRDVAGELTDQFRGLMLREYDFLAPPPEGTERANVRIKFRIWPGQGALVESSVKQAFLFEMKRIAPDYADWMICVQYRVANDDVPFVAAKTAGGGEGI